MIIFRQKQYVKINNKLRGCVKVRNFYKKSKGLANYAYNNSGEATDMAIQYVGKHPTQAVVNGAAMIAPVPGIGIIPQIPKVREGLNRVDKQIGKNPVSKNISNFYNKHLKTPTKAVATALANQLKIAAGVPI